MDLAVLRVAHFSRASDTKRNAMKLVGWLNERWLSVCSRKQNRRLRSFSVDENKRACVRPLHWSLHMVEIGTLRIVEREKPHRLLPLVTRRR